MDLERQTVPEFCREGESEEVREQLGNGDKPFVRYFVVIVVLTAEHQYHPK